MPFSWSIERFETVQSTQSVLRDHAQLRHGLVVHADEQTAGYGRQRRAWLGGKGNLFISFALEADYDPHIYGQIALVCGLAVLKAMKDVVPECQPVLKWPNDVLLGERKACGILIEKYEDARAGRALLLVGVGANINQAPHSYSSLCEYADSEIDLNNFVGLFLNRFFDLYTELRHDGFQRLQKLWLEYSLPKDSKISVHVGNEHVKGRFMDIDSFGHLRLICDDNKQVRTISSGDVFLI